MGDPVIMLIPNTKTELILLKEWSFRLFYEDRNDALLKALRLFSPDTQHYSERFVSSRSSELRYTSITLPTGTVLRVSRVYIRQGTTETYDSLTFTIKQTTAQGSDGKPLKGRFWAKLGDINGKMDAELYFGQTLTSAEQASRFDLLFAD